MLNDHFEFIIVQWRILLAEELPHGYIDTSLLLKMAGVENVLRECVSNIQSSKATEKKVRLFTLQSVTRYTKGV